MGSNRPPPPFLPPSWQSCSTGRSYGAAGVASYHGFSVLQPTDLVVVVCRLPGADRRCELCRLVVVVRRLLGAERCREVSRKKPVPLMGSTSSLVLSQSAQRTWCHLTLPWTEGADTREAKVSGTAPHDCASLGTSARRKWLSKMCGFNSRIYFFTRRYALMPSTQPNRIPAPSAEDAQEFPKTWSILHNSVFVLARTFQQR